MLRLQRCDSFTRFACKELDTGLRRYDDYFFFEEIFFVCFFA